MSVRVKTDEGWKIVSGSSGGSKGIVITKAEYDALPDSKLTDGVDYYIEDWTESGGGGGSSSLDYETEQLATGITIIRYGKLRILIFNISVSNVTANMNYNFYTLPYSKDYPPFTIYSALGSGTQGKTGEIEVASDGKCYINGWVASGTFYLRCQSIWAVE